MYANDISSDQGDAREAQSFSIIQLPGYIRDFKEYSGSINPKMIRNLKNQFESDPNTAMIKDEVNTLSDNEDSFLSNEKPDSDTVDTTPIMQTTLKMRYLMERFKIKDESYLGNALIQESLKSYVDNMNKRSIISKSFKEQSEQVRRERDGFSNMSAWNVYELKKKHYQIQQNNVDFQEISKRRASQQENMFDLQVDSVKEKMVPKLKQWQKEINCLNQSNHDEFLKLRRNEEIEMKAEFQEKFRLNKVFQFNLNRSNIGNAPHMSRANPKRDILPQAEKVERYQDNIFGKLPPDIDSISQNIIEYIDLTGAGNLQPQNIVDIKEDILNAVGKFKTEEPNLDALSTKAIFQDCIETFSTVIEENQGLNMDLLTFQREISPIARTVVKGNKLKLENFEEAEMIKNDDNEINFDEIKDEEILNIISGRINSKNLKSKIKQFEQIKRKQSQQIEIQEQGESKEELNLKLNEIRNNLIQKGKTDQYAQACLMRPSNNGKVNKEMQDSVLNTSSNSRSQKSDRSMNFSGRRAVSTQAAGTQMNLNYENQRTNPNSRRGSVFRRMNQNPSQIISQLKQQNPSMFPIASLQKKGQQFLSVAAALVNKKAGSRLSERDELTSINSLKEVDNDGGESDYNDTARQQKEDDSIEKYNEVIEEVDSLESDHNRLLRLIISAQISPDIFALCQEIKQLRIVKNQILKSSNVSEAVTMTKFLNESICRKLKEMLTILFKGNCDFESGLEELLKSVSRINSKQNSLEQGRLKLAFVLLSDFRKALLNKQLKFNNLTSSDAQNQCLNIQQIEHTLGEYQKKKQFSKFQQQKLEKELDYNKLTFYNFRKNKTNSKSQSDLQNTNPFLRTNNSISSTSLAQNSKNPLTLKNNYLIVSSKKNFAPLASTDIRKNTPPLPSIDQISSIDKTPKSQRSSTSRNRSTSSNFLQLNPIQRRSPISDVKSSSTTPKRGRQQIQIIPDTQKSAQISNNSSMKNTLSTKNGKNNIFKEILPNFEEKPIQQENKKNTQNLWNNAKAHLINIQTNKSSGLDWLESIKQLQTAKKKEEQKKKEEEQFREPLTQQQQRKILQIQTVIHDFESVISNGLLSTKSLKSPSNKFDSTTANSIVGFSSTSPQINSNKLTSPVKGSFFGSVKQSGINSPQQQLRNKSQNIFEYLSKESLKTEMEKSRGSIYQKQPSSLNLVRNKYSKSPKRRN